MGLSRLDNFLKSIRGTVLYVDLNALDATDSVENTGSSLIRPFKSIQRALIEAARYSYQRGLNNDRFSKTTIIVYPGDYSIDNRPGWIPDGEIFRLRDGSTETSNAFPEWDPLTVYDLNTADNALYKLNSVYGGVIIPRGVSLIGIDLRKTKIRPLYVPNPENDNIERSCIFRVTGSSYISKFTVLDASPNGNCYKDYTSNTFTPNFSHHKLSFLEYADGVNPVKITDDFISGYDAGTRTDLTMYYEKVGLVYGSSSGREIANDYPFSTVDIQPVVDEYRIVGSTGQSIGISSIRAGDGVTANTVVTVTLSEPFSDIAIDSPIQIEGVTQTGYDGQFVVNSVISSTQFTYLAPSAPASALGSVASAVVNLTTESVTSSSPYIDDISVKSVYGMCGIYADGDKATGFKSMLASRFTGVSLQKDDNAFVRYDNTTGTYKDATSNFSNLFADSLAKYKPEYENFHIKAVNNAYLTLSSVFAIGYANHYVSESGSDLSLSSSNSTFGSKALVASGFKKDAFSRDNQGYITHIITPKDIEFTNSTVEFVSLDVGKIIGIGSTNKFYLYNYNDSNVKPPNIVDGYRIGAKPNDNLFVEVLSSGISTEYSARIIMPSTQYSGNEVSFEKSFRVSKTVSDENDITDTVVTLTQPHTFQTGESIRVISNDGNLPSLISPSQVYFAITNDVATGIGSTQIKIAQNYTDAFQNIGISPNKKGGNLTIVSRVSDKISGDVGHPIQWDSTQNQWYINVATASTENTIYSAIVGLGTTSVSASRSFIKRNKNSRNIADSIYKVRYVIPKTSSAKVPTDSFVIQDASSGIGTGALEVAKFFDITKTLSLGNPNELRSPRFIATCSWNSSVGIVTVRTEIPHELNIGNKVEIIKVQSTPNNTTGIANTGFNGIHVVSGINNSKEFTYELSNNPGVFVDNTSVRNADLPRFSRKTLNNTYQLYRSQEVQEYIKDVQDGIYHLLVVDYSTTPTIEPFTGLKFSHPLQNLYPQLNRDNPVSDPESVKSFAAPDTIGKVVINDPQNSVTRKTLENFVSDIHVGFGITNIISNSVGSSHTIFSTYDHGFAGITSVSITGTGSTYTAGTYYNVPLVGAAGSLTGNHATAVVTIGAAGTVTDVLIMDRGSSYGIGNTLSILSIPRNAGSVDAYVTVTGVQNNIGDVLVISGLSSSQYNATYRITELPVGQPTRVVVASASSIANSTVVGLGSTASSFATVVRSGKSIGISTFTYDASSGLSTITFSTPHGFKLNEKIEIGGSFDPLFNQKFVVKASTGIGTTAPTLITIDTGVKNASVDYGGTLVAYPLYLGAYGGDVTETTESLASRVVPTYAGITTLSTAYIPITSTDNDPLTIRNAVLAGLRIGDYIQIDNEIFRIRQAVTSDQVYVFRSVLGTEKQTHLINSIVKTVRPIPIEFRRNSLIKATAHTFEYVGFGPGNYSTALPEKQDRDISEEEEILAQSTKIDGGVTIVSGMNDQGDFYIGNKKINGASGSEEVFDAPVPTVTGEEPKNSGLNVGFDILSPLEISVNRSIKVEGGPDSSLMSKFDGPVIFTNKLTSTSSKGIEASSISLQGDSSASRNFTVGVSTPTSAGSPGDVVTRTLPESGRSLGWVYTTSNQWEKFGVIGKDGSEPGIGVGIASAGNYVGFSTLINFVGVGVSIFVETDKVINGITTITIDDNPTIGISTGAFNTLLGSAKQLNFVGAGVTVSNIDPTGIVTITMDKVSLAGLGPADNYNTFQYHQNDDTFAGLDYFVYNNTNDNIQISDINVTRTGYISLGSTNPDSKLEIHSAAARSLLIKSTTGSGEIVKIENAAGDLSPFIIDNTGSVGINTGNILSGISLDVVGNSAFTGQIRYYNESRQNYVALQAVSGLSSTYTLSLPNVVGAANSLLHSVSPGVLGWTSIKNALSLATTDDLPEGTTNLYYTNQRVSDKVKSMIGDQCGITVTFNSATGKIDYEVIVSQEYAPWPYSTRGFAIPI